MSWQRPWRLRTSVVHQWRAFPERLHALATSEDEVTIVTAGPCSNYAVSVVGGFAEVQILDCRTLDVGTLLVTEPSCQRPCRPWHTGRRGGRGRALLEPC
jgi:hypothetical protein